MANRSTRSADKLTLKATPPTSDGNALQNTILLGLPRNERDEVLSKSEFISASTHTVLNEMAEPIQFAYFINNGLASILNVMSDGKTVEVGLMGSEGFVGLPLIVGFATSPTLAVMQIGGSAYRTSAQDLADLVRQCPNLEKNLQRFSQEFALQVAQVAACNRLHQVQERLARWLLMSEDRVKSSTFLLTQEFLAHMLGTRRASVTVAAGILQKTGLITYRRGQVTIQSRPGLENATCECYRQLAQQIQRWHNQSRRTFVRYRTE